MDCNSSKCEYSIFHQKGCRNPACIKVRETRTSPLPSRFRRVYQLVLIHRIMAPKYKKWSTRSTMTALRVAPQQPGPLLLEFPRLGFTSPYAHTHTTRPLPEHQHEQYPTSSSDQLIISMGFSLHHTALPSAACCPPDLFLSRRHNCIPHSLAHHPPLHVYPLTRLVIALLYHHPVCIAAICNEPVDVLRLTLALQHLSSPPQYLSYFSTSV
jgi:hypothetical protein